MYILCARLFIAWDILASSGHSQSDPAGQHRIPWLHNVDSINVVTPCGHPQGLGLGAPLPALCVGDAVVEWFLLCEPLDILSWSALGNAVVEWFVGQVCGVVLVICQLLGAFNAPLFWSWLPTPV